MGSGLAKDVAYVVYAFPLTTLAFQGRLGRSIDFGGSKMMTRDEARIRLFAAPTGDLAPLLHFVYGIA